MEPLCAQSAKALAPAPIVPESSQPDATATRDDLIGSYIWDEYSYSNSHGGWNYLYCAPEIEAGGQPDEIIINGFWNDFDDYGNPLSSVVATFDAEKSTVSFPSGTYLGTYGEYPAYIYISDWNTDILEEGPIVFNYDPRLHQLVYQCDYQNDGVTPVKTLLITSYPDALGKKITKGVDFIGYIRMSQYNTSMNVNNTTLGESGVCWGYVDHTDSGFSFRNFAGYGFDTSVDFTPYYGPGTVYAHPAICRTDALLSDNTRADIYYAGADGGDIHGTISACDDQPGKFLVEIPEWTLYNRTADKVFMRFIDTRFYISLPSSGVDTVFDSSANGSEPAYYDLQGRRLKSAAPLCIERRGTEVKIIRNSNY